MQKILTLIIPTYNRSNKIEKTLSLIDCGIVKDLNIIVVDDGSTDNTELMVKPFIEKFPEVFHYCKKDNGNWGSVMNYIFPLVESKYLKILDSDDQLINLNEFIEKLKMIDADLVVTDFGFRNGSEFSFRSFSKVFKKQNALDKTMDLDEINLYKQLLSIHSLTLSKRMYKMVYDLPEGIFYTDSLLVLKTLTFAKTIHYINDFPVYMYIVHAGEQSMQLNMLMKNQEQYQKILDIGLDIEIPDDISDKRKYTIARALKTIIYLNVLIISLDKSLDWSSKHCRILELLKNVKNKLPDEFYNNYINTRYFHFIIKMKGNISILNHLCFIISSNPFLKVIKKDIK